MSDVPDDLTSVGRHRGHQPPEETGQTVSSPDGPDPSAGLARRTPALFQLLRPAENRLQIRAHPPRAQVSAPDDADEVGRYRSAEALHDALASEGVAGWTGVFEDVEADRVLTDDVTADHAWIGQPRYPTITLFADAEDAASYAERTTVTAERP